MKTVLFALSILVASPALAADDNSNVLKVENGVTVKSGTPSQQFSPEVSKNGNVRNEFFDPRVQDTKSSATAAPVVDLPTVTSPSEKKPASSDGKMKPIISSNSPAKKVAKKVPAAKPEVGPITADQSPFKKSQDANAVETVKKPEPQPEVKAQTLPGSVPKGSSGNGDIMQEIEKIDKMGNEKPVATPDLPLSALVGADKSDESNGKPLQATGESGLPIPRFVTFKSGEVNARTGPGENYPIRWLYQRKNLPVEITAEFKLWRRIKDFDGEESWVHHAMVSSRRYGIIGRDVSAKSGPDSGDKIANFKRGVQVKIEECKEISCDVQYGKIEGWVPKKSLWGVYAKEVFH